MMRLFAWPRSPSRIMLWRDRIALTSCGMTVSSYPTIPGNSFSPARSFLIRFSRSSSLTERLRYLNALSSRRVPGYSIFLGGRDCNLNRPVLAQLLEVREHRAFGHGVSFGGNVSVNPGNNLFRICRALTHRLQNILFALQPVRDVFLDLAIRG